MSGKNSRQERAEKLAQVKKQQKKSNTTRTAILVTAIATPLVSLLVVAAVIIGGSLKGSGLEEVPPSASGMGQPIVIGEVDETVPTVDIYEDFQCPYCAQFENIQADTLKQLADEGEANVQIHLMSFLDNALGNDSSVRAARGAIAADEQGKFAEYHRLVYANPPEQEGQGWSDEQLEDFAVDAGVEDLDKWRTDFNSDKYDAYIDSMQEASQDAGVTGTPTIKINGEDVETASIATPETLIAAVEAASVTSTPSPSSTN